MAVVNTFACDICGAQKLSMNHWWVAMYSSARPRLDYFPNRIPLIILSLATTKQFRIYEPQFLEVELEVAHLCGEECVLKFTERWLGKQKECSRQDAGGTKFEEPAGAAAEDGPKSVTTHPATDGPAISPSPQTKACTAEDAEQCKVKTTTRN